VSAPAFAGPAAGASVAATEAGRSVSRTDPFVQWVLNIPNGVACLTFPISSFRRIVDTWFIDLEVQLSGGNYVAADGSNEGFARVSFTTTNSGSD